VWCPKAIELTAVDRPATVYPENLMLKEKRMIIRFKVYFSNNKKKIIFIYFCLKIS
jgi:hypothetical protein